MVKTFEELQAALASILPKADIQTDGHGQIIIYTGMTTPWLKDVIHSDDDNTLIEFKG